jgi:hypothetical protein
MPDDLLRAMLDPTAPLPAGWPSGTLGAFLLFLVPVGGGIPAGVLMARDGGASALLTALLYLVSDVVMSFTGEAMLKVVMLLGRWIPALGRLGQRLVSLSGNVGLRDSGVRGPLGLIMVSFTVSPLAGRAAAATAGHGFVTGWALAIAGDMLYFTLLMASTLWLSSVLGDERLTVGAVLAIMFVAPMLLRRLRGAGRPAVVGAATAPTVVAGSPAGSTPLLVTAAASRPLARTAGRPKSSGQSAARRGKRGKRR